MMNSLDAPPPPPPLPLKKTRCTPVSYTSLPLFGRRLRNKRLELPLLKNDHALDYHNPQLPLVLVTNYICAPFHVATK